MITLLADILRHVRQRILLHTETILTPLHMTIAVMLDDDGTNSDGQRKQRKSASDGKMQGSKAENENKPSPSAVDDKERCCLCVSPLCEVNAMLCIFVVYFYLCLCPCLCVCVVSVCLCVRLRR